MSYTPNNHGAMAQETRDQLSILRNTMEKIEVHLDYLKKSMTDNTEQHKEILDKIGCLEKNFATKDEFNFWRAILVSGILLTIFIGIIALFMNK